jgi:hypothetical protein
MPESYPRLTNITVGENSMLKIQHLLGITLIHASFTVALIVFNDPEQHQRRHFHPDVLNNLD